MDKKYIEEKILTLSIETRPFINGEYVNSESAQSIDKMSPVDMRVLPKLNACNKISILFIKLDFSKELKMMPNLKEYIHLDIN